MGAWLVVAGTRPEVTKLNSVVTALRARGARVTVALTGQHGDLLTTTADSPRLQWFLADAHQWNLPPSGDPGEFAERVARRVEVECTAAPYDGVIVQGDTASAYGAAVGAERMGVRIAHVEAGVRTGDPSSPWPEEPFRVAIDRLARWGFCSTSHCHANLQAEGVEQESWVTGSTGIDDLVADHMTPQERPVPLVLVTLHRRETLGQLPEIVGSLEWLAARRPDVLFLWPTHPNPRVQQAVVGLHHLRVIPPYGAAAFRRMLRSAQLVLTDSGGVQEEAAHLGVPCLVARTVTDRPESVEAGVARVIGTDPVPLTLAVRDEVDEPAMARCPCPVYGDGQSGTRIAGLLHP